MEEVLDTLEPTEVTPAELEKEDLIRILNQRDAEIKNYMQLVDNISKENKDLIDLYNKDMEYLSTINSNIIKIHRVKEDCVRNIIDGALTLLTIDRNEIAPERKENE